MPISGSALRAERARKRVTISALAARMGLTRQTLWGIERAEVVDPARVLQYRSALNDISDTSRLIGGDDGAAA